MEFDLHRAGDVPEWELTEPGEHNIWQKIAANTQGIVTPGNVITVGSAVLFMDGLYDYSQGQKPSGFIKMLGGALGDWIDGKVAARTETKSPLGETLDASLDKAKMLGALVVLGVTEVVPVLPLVIVGTQNLANTVFTGIAKARHREVHAEMSNKLTPWVQGIGLAGFIASDIISPGIGQQLAEATGYAGTVLGTLTVGSLGTKNLYDYAFKPQQQPGAV